MGPLWLNRNMFQRKYFNNNKECLFVWDIYINNKGKQMILHLTDRKGNNTLLIDTINHKRLLDKLNRTSEELEKKVYI